MRARQVQQLVLAALVLGASLGVVLRETAATRRARTRLLDAPSAFARELAVLPRKTVVTVLDERQRWAHIELSDPEVRGWVAASSLVPPGRLSTLWKQDAPSAIALASALRGFRRGLAVDPRAERDLPSPPALTPADLDRFTRPLRQARQTNRNTVGWLGEVADVPASDVTEAERALGIAAATRLAATGLVDDPGLHRYLDLIAATLADASPAFDQRFQVFVLDDESIAAYSAPGGYLFVTRGALRFCTDEAEAAALLAHELAHVLFQHGLAEVQARAPALRAERAFDELDRLAAAMDTVDAVVSDLEADAETMMQHLVHPRTVAYETAADRLAVFLLLRAGYDVHALERTLARAADAPRDRLQRRDDAARRTALRTLLDEHAPRRPGRRLAERYRSILAASFIE